MTVLGVRKVVAAVRVKAENTPASRERQVDLLRAVAICMVVVGHWLITAVGFRDGLLSGQNALGVLSWSHPVTWLFQVMPIFFLVGGFSNAASLTSYRRAGGDGPGWVLHRTDRLLRPATVLLVSVPLAALMAVAAGADQDLVGRATWLVCMPLWFLLAYLAMVVLTPWTHAVHRRIGLAAPAALVVLVGLGDLLRMGFDVPYVGEASYLFGWLAIHQLGYSWQDRRLPTSRRSSWTIAGVGLVALLLFTLAGPYEIRMVGGNTNPPTLALLALATTQVGIVLALREPTNRWLARPRPWTVVVAVNAVVLTVFLWHMTAALLTALVAYPTGVLAQPPITSAAWLAWRMPWLVLCAVTLGVLVAAFGWIELRRGTTAVHATGGPVRTILTAVAVALLLGGGLLGVALAGPEYHGLGALPTPAILTYLAGAAMLRGLRHGWGPRPSHAPQMPMRTES